VNVRPSRRPCGAEHWEKDLLARSRNTHVVPLVERTLRFVMLVRVGGMNTGRWLGTLASR